MRSLRRTSAAVWLAALRVQRGAGRALVVALGIAASTMMLVAVHAGVLVAQDASIAARIAALPDEVRAIRVFAFGASGQSDAYRALDRRARAKLEPLVGRKPVATVLYKESTIAGAYVSLGAVDGLARWVRLTSGRLPRPCMPERCEVLRIRGRGRIPNAPRLRLVPVGRGALVSSVLFGDAIPPAKNARHENSLSEQYRSTGRYHRPAPAPIVLAEGVAGLARSPVLRTYRTFGWHVPLESSYVHPWTIEQLVRDIESLRSTLGVASTSFQLEAPVEELTDARAATTVAGRRLLLLGGLGSALLLAFAAFAAARLRRDVDSVRQRLTWLGAPSWQIRLLVATEAWVVGLVGGFSGWAAGVGISAALASRADRPVAELVAQSALSVDGLVLAAAVATVGAAALFAAVSIRPVRLGSRSFSPLDAAAAAAAAVLAVALLRGEADAHSLVASRGTGVVLLLLPALIVFVAAVAAARTLPPVLRALERLARSRSTSLRLAALALARNPGYAAVTVAFLVVSIGLATFAESYRSTLVSARADQAEFAVPTDFVLREDLSRLVPVADVATDQSVVALRASGAATDVTRLSASLDGVADVGGIELLGLEPRAIRELDGWRRDFSNRPLGALARAVSPEQPVELAGAPIPASARTLVLRASARGQRPSVTASIEGGDGSFAHVAFGRLPPRELFLAAPLPPDARGGRLVALRFDPPPRLVERGSDAGGPAEAVVTLGALRGGGFVVTDFGAWRGVSGALPLSTDPLRLRLTLSRAVRTYLRPGPPVDERPLPAIVSPRLAELAGDGGRLPLRVGGAQVVVRVAAVAALFPSTGSRTFSGDFAVVDHGSLVTALNTQRPGAGFTNEIWIRARKGDVNRVAARLRAPPFDVLAVESRRSLERELLREPVARASLAMLAGSAVVALVLAFVGLALGALTELRDERGELFDLETQGLGPRALRRQVRLRAATLVAVGLVGAAATGVALSLLVVRFVRLTASATAANPPLVLAISWPVVGVAVAAVLVVSALLVGGATAAAFRAPSIPRYGQRAG